METCPWRSAGRLVTSRPFRLIAVFIAVFIVSLDAKYLTADSDYRKKGCFKFYSGTYTTSPGSSSGCGGGYCPQCFLLATDFGAVKVTLQTCSATIFSQKTSTTVLANFQFTNIGRGLGEINDGINTFFVPAEGTPGSSVQCNCHNNELTCDSIMSPVLTTHTHSASTFQATHRCADIIATVALDLRAANCPTPLRFCPQCYRLDTSSATVSLTLTYCSYYFEESYEITAVIEYQFINSGTNLAYVSDGTNKYTLNKYGNGQNQMNCLCRANLLSCDNPTIQLDAAAEGIAKFPASLSVNGPIYFGTSIKMEYNSGDARINTVVGSSGSSRGLSVGDSVGTLHGTWTADATVTTSDVRMKKDIRPLQDHLRSLQQTDTTEGRCSSPEECSMSPAQLIISKLRPVSYSYKRYEGRRYGFVADEVLEVLPDMVRIDKAEKDMPDMKKLLILDFIALLVSALQGQQQTLEAIGKRGEQHQHATAHRLSAIEHEIGEHHQHATAHRLSAIEHEMGRVWTEVALLREQVSSCRANCAA